MKKILLSFTTILVTLSFTACSNKIPDAEKVQWDKNSALGISKELLLKKEFIVPKDPDLKKQNWTYQVVAQKNDKDFFKNEEIVKVFLTAHNSNEIILIGKEDLIKEYKNYFLENQVTANIILQVVNPIKRDFDKVNILFFNNLYEDNK